jgi:dTMP kinase
MFITFEGIDNSGKTTQIRLLEKFFRGKGHDVVIIREPGGTEISEKIRHLLLDEKNNISVIAELFLFEAARAELTDKVIKPALESGKIVLCDRFFDSTTAYQGYGRGLELEKIVNINLFATGGIVPDLTIYLEISLHDSKGRNHTGQQDRMEQSGDGFFERVIKGFDELCSKETNRFLRVNAKEEKYSVHQMITEFINKKFNI